MQSTSKRKATTSARYTFSDEDEVYEGGTVKKTGKVKKKKEDKGKTTVCKICHKKYTGKDGLKRHMTLHKDTLDYACDMCDARFKTNQYLTNHRKRVHSPPTHECDFCGRCFTMPSKMEQHRLIHTGEKPHKCEVCGKAFRAVYSLNTHRFLHTNEKPFKCLYCPYACRDSSTLRKHHERHTGTLKWHECAYCDKKYYAKSLLKNHVSEKHFAVDLKVIPCPQCDSKFRTKGQLNTHIKVVHRRELRVTCEVCGVEVSSKHNMAAHLRKHLHVRPYKCRVKSCQRRFKDVSIYSKHNMAAHLRKHLHVRPYKCRVKSCQRRFKDVSTLKKHSLIHTPAEQLACEVCGKLFARRNRLNVHMRRHGDDTKTSFKVMFCDYCGFSYDNKPRLIRHMLKHIRHRNTYVCDVCKFITHKKLSIEKHMKYGHGDEDDRYCRICDKSYKLHAYLILHYYNRHGVRYKTLKNIKLETSVTIKEEPQEPIPDAEVDLEEIQKQEPLADIITDVALDCDATDLSYSKSVLSEDIRRSTPRHVQQAAARTTFRRRLRGRAALIEEQNTLYARKEKDVKKRINRLLARVRHKKWARMLERARRQYNQTIRKACAVKQTDHNTKVKFVNVNQANINKKTEMDQNDNNNDQFEKNSVNYEITVTDRCEQIVTNSKDVGEFKNRSICTSDRETNDGIARNYDLVKENNVENGVSYDSDNETEKDEDNMTNDDTLDSFVNDNEVSVRNIYEDVLDIEENPIGEMNGDEIDTIINNREINKSKPDNLDIIDVDKRVINNANVNDLQDKDSNVNESISENTSDIKTNNTSKLTPVDSKNNVINLKNNFNSADNFSHKGTLSSEDNNLQTENLCSPFKGNNKNDSEKISRNKSKENSDSNNSENYQNDDDGITDNDCERDKIINDKVGERGKNVKLKINTHQCYVCHKLYETKKQLLDHCQEHFDVCTDIPLKKCPLCNYVTKRTITTHLNLVHDITISLSRQKLLDKNKYTEESSRFCYNVDDKVVKEIEIIPSVSNLNKIAYVEIDKKNRKTKDLSVAKTKLVKKSGEWIVEQEKMNVNNDFILPKFDKKEIKRLKHVGDSYLDVIKVLGRLAKRHKAKMLYPCNGCEKLCQSFAALKLHSRRHEANPKPFKKKVWKHKTKQNELKPVKTRYSRVKPVNNDLRQAEPKPIENKHKCDKKLMDFYEQNVKGANIEFWQFLKIYNRMNKDHENLENLTETNEFGDYIEKSETAPIQNDVVLHNNRVTPQKVVTTNNRLSKNVSSKFTRKIVLSKEERLRRARIKEQLRKKITENT